MKRLTLAAGIVSLLSVTALEVLSLRAQNPERLPAVSEELLNRPNPIPQPVPDPLTSQPDQGPKAQDTERSEFAKYPVWLLIKPDGIRFLQNQEEIATNQHAIPPNAFLLGCATVNFEGAAGEPKPDFQLSCEDFLLTGRFGAQQNLDVTGASLSYSTQTQQIQLRGDAESPLEYHSVDAASETRMQADEIRLQLQPGGRPFIRQRSDENRVVNEHVRVTASSFQVSAKNITALETIANPAPIQNSPARGDAPMWDPQLRENEFLEYGDPLGDPRSTPKPHDNNNDHYAPPSGELRPATGRFESKNSNSPGESGNESFKIPNRK